MSETITRKTAVLCGNESHLDDSPYMPPAVARVTFPDGRFKPTTACKSCIKDILADYGPGGDYEHLAIHIVPVGKEPDRSTLERLVLRACGDPGSVLKRESLHEDWDGSMAMESLPHWQMRAVMAVIEPSLTRECADG